jgi:antitoxin component YwqK of YwqJK toxin-antitoxin module
MSFRIVITIDIESETEIPTNFSGRVRKSTNGVLDYTAWYHNGKMEDPSSTSPAYVRYRRSGEAKQERHYRLGRLHDPSPEFPAVRGYFANGAVKYEERYRYGRRHDSRGTPALIKWRLDGTVRSQRHYWEGLQVDEPKVPTST